METVGTGRLISEAKVSGTGFVTRRKSKSTLNKSNSILAAKYAYLACKVESGSIGQGVIGYLINNDRSNFCDKFIGFHTSGTVTTAKNFSSQYNAAVKYANSVAAGGTEVKKSDGVTKLEYNSNYDAFGAITATFPTNAKIYIALNGVNYSEYTGNVRLASNGSYTPLKNCSGKPFYIPFSALSGATDFNQVKIKIEATSDVMTAKYLYCFQSSTSTKSGQNQAVLRGKTTKLTTNIQYNVEAIANVSVLKEVSQKSDKFATPRTLTASRNGDYVDRGDIVYFKITVSNNGPATKYDLTDTYNANYYDFIGFYNYGGTRLNVSAQNGIIKLNNIDIAKGTKTIYKVALRVKENLPNNIVQADTPLTNQAMITNFRINNKAIKNKPGNVESSQCFVKCKRYKITVQKAVSSASAEPGAALTYNIYVKNNNASSSVKYGDITYSILENMPEGFDVTNKGIWTLSGSNYTATQTIESGGNKNLQIQMKVSESLVQSVPVNKTNTVTITSVKNRNDIDLTPYLEGSTLSSSSTVKILGYKLEVSKAVEKIRTALGKDTGSLTQCELGDIVTYKITVANTGTKGNYANIENIVINDIFKTNELEFVKFEPANAKVTKDGGSQNYKISSLAPGEKVEFRVSMKVILESKQKIKIANTAKLIQARNQYNVDLMKLLAQESTVSVEYQTYDMGLWKYISKVQETEITNRKDLNNIQKNDSPVEVEQNQMVEYTIVAKNTGTTMLKDIVIKDTLEAGLTFDSVISAKKINKDGSEDTVESQAISTPTNVNDLRFAYSGEIGPEQSIEIKLKAKVTMSNMYLLNLKNEFEIEKIMNRNDVDLALKDLVNYTNKENIDYVRLKNLIFSGKVWVDLNRDGKMDANETKMPGMKVILHDVTNGKTATTYTDNEGNYKFGETNGTLLDGTEALAKMVEKDGRVIKATDRDDATGNYKPSSNYINYYIEFCYNGANYVSTIYAPSNGRGNLNPADNSITNAYTIDSNAKAYDDVVEAFNKGLETIAYNTGIAGEKPDETNTQDLSYTKKNHESILDFTDNLSMSAYSFAIDNTNFNGGIADGQNINMLFFSRTGDTDYLKYINLGLQLKQIDVNIYEDVEKIRTTVNGYQMSYFLGQGKVTDSPYGGEYAIGGAENSLNYEFRWYASDYYYKHTDYKAQAVKDYKENTELNTEVTYKITVSNKDIQDKNETYTIIREIADFYSSDFITYDPNNNEKTIKVLDNGFLKTETIKCVEAWYEYGTSNGPVTISNDSDYPYLHSDVNLDEKYNVLYLSGFKDLKLKQGESFDVYIKFVVNTEDGTYETPSNIGDKNNIVEINSYSTYYEKDKKPAGLVDKNSNPGNLGLTTIDSNPKGEEGASIEDYSQYENDAYKTGVNIDILERLNIPGQEDEDEGTLERVIRGTVWDDARSETVGTDKDLQYVGNGIKNIGGDAKNKDAETNKKGINEEKDTLVQGVNAELIEMVKIKVGDEVRTYEEKAIQSWKDAVTSTKTDKDGIYELQSFIPGDYVVRFNYGESKEDVMYNGQEYKSTTYKNIEDKVTSDPDSGDKVLEALEEEVGSDARDDEIRRLEVIAYSENVNNKKTEEAQKREAEEYTTEFMDNTFMYADTEIFPVRIEKTPYNIKEYSFKEHMTTLTNTLRYNIKNIDFGLEYRPETDISIKEFLSRIKLTTNDGNTLVDIKFDDIEDDNGIIIGTEINEKESIGLEELQYLPSTEDVKGLAYLNVDVDLLQGCTVEITYVFSTTNISEIDRISKNLYNLRYKADVAENNTYKEYLYENKFTAAETARDELYSKYYAKDSEDEYKIQDKAYGEYYGKYLGSTYYNGELGENDVISKLKVDMILDYVDNNMTMVASKNAEAEKYWKTMTSKDLEEQGLIAENIFNAVKQKINGNEVESGLTSQLMDANGVLYDVETRHNLAISVDDKLKANDEGNMNKSLSKFLTPYKSKPEESSGHIYLTTTKVLSGGSDTEDMTYNNSAEILQFTSSTGRITSLGTTVGNLDMSAKNPDYKETDSAFTEKVSLTPPTGLEKTKYYVNFAKDQIIRVTIILGVIIAIIILKRSLKNVSFKKFYK